MSTRALKVGDIRDLTSRSRAALGNPLYRSGYALVANTAATTAVGVAFWAVAAHLYSQTVVGRGSALVAALILVSSIAQLNLGSTLPRFLPLAGRRSGRLIRYCYAANSVVALFSGLLFVTLLPRLNSHWHFMRGSLVLEVGFVVGLLIWGVFALEDAALTGLRRAVVVPFENTAYGILKLILLIAIAGVAASTGIFVSWILPLVVIVPVINYLIFRRYAKKPEFLRNYSAVRASAVIRFAAVDYVGAVLGQIYTNLLPLLVLSTLGPESNATFYIAWSITQGAALIGTNFATSLLVEGAAAPKRLAELTRGVLGRCALITVPCVLVLTGGAHLVLTIYGAKYAAAATLPLDMLALAIVPRNVVLIVFSLDRLAGKVGRATFTNLILAILVLGGSWALLKPVGIEGVVIAWGGGNLIIALVRLPTLLAAIRRRQGDLPEASASAPPSPLPSGPSPSGVSQAEVVSPNGKRDHPESRRPASGRHRTANSLPRS
jgi:O-antigen/teichoic acid export membrane protein